MSENNAPYLKKATLKGYKSIKDGVEIDLLPGMNIIIGPNGSGKSNFLELVERMLSDKKNGKNISPKLETHLVLNTKSPILDLFWKKNDVGVLEKRCFEGKELRSYDDLIHRNADFFFKINFNRPEIELLDKNLNFVISVDNTGLIYSPNPDFSFTYSDIELKIILHFFKVEFGDIAANVYHSKNQNNFQLLNSLFDANSLIKKAKVALKNFTPVEDFRFNEGYSVKINNALDEININYLRLEFFINNEWLDWQQLSDGTKRLFYIVAEVTAQENSIILLEEPELGVHPHQLFKLMSFLKEQSKHKQIIMTTHSPDVLNILTSDELDRIVVAEMTEKGTKMRHLTEKQVKKAQKYMASELSLGDYWVHSDLEPQNTAL